MTDVWACSHGGDGGNLPPHGDPRRIPSGCESSSSTNRRGRGANRKLNKNFESNGKKPLILQVVSQGGHVKFVGENQSDFIRLISNHIFCEFPMYYRGWNDVPQTFKDGLYETLHYYFDLDSLYESGEEQNVKCSLIKECQRAYKDRKNELKRHYDRINGPADPEQAKLNPPNAFDQDRWIELIDKLFTDERYLRRCASNRANRKNIPYPSLHGSQSYTQMRWVEQTKTNEPPSYLSGFEKTHTRDGQWVDEQARLDYVQLSEKQERLRASQPAGEDEFFEDETFRNVFGQSRGYQRGIGHLVPKTLRVVTGGNSSSGPRSGWHEQMQAKHEQKLKAQQEEHQRQMQAQQEEHQRQMQAQQEQHQKQMQELFFKFEQDFSQRWKNMQRSQSHDIESDSE